MRLSTRWTWLGGRDVWCDQMQSGAPRGCFQATTSKRFCPSPRQASSRHHPRLPVETCLPSTHGLPPPLSSHRRTDRMRSRCRASTGSRCPCLRPTATKGPHWVHRDGSLAWPAGPLVQRRRRLCQPLLHRRTKAKDMHHHLPATTGTPLPRPATTATTTKTCRTSVRGKPIPHSTAHSSRFPRQRRRKRSTTR